MANLPTSTSPKPPAFPPAPPAASRPLDDLVSRISSGLEGTGTFGRRSISVALAPSDEQRETLLARRNLLRRSVVPVPEATRKIVTALLSGWPAYGAAEADAKAVVGLVCRALDDAPPWAVAVAAERFVKGYHTVAWDPAKAPTAPQVRAEVQAVLAPVDREMVRLSAILDAEVIGVACTDEQRADMLARWAEVRAGIEASNGVGRSLDDPDHPERVAMREANRRFQAQEADREGETVGRRMFGKVPMSLELTAQQAERDARDRVEEFAA